MKHLKATSYPIFGIKNKAKQKKNSYGITKPYKEGGKREWVQFTHMDDTHETVGKNNVENNSGKISTHTHRHIQNEKNSNETKKVRNECVNSKCKAKYILAKNL